MSAREFSDIEIFQNSGKGIPLFMAGHKNCLQADYLLGPGPRLIKKRNLPGRGLMKVEKHCLRQYMPKKYPNIHDITYFVQRTTRITIFSEYGDRVSETLKSSGQARTNFHEFKYFELNRAKYFKYSSIIYVRHLLKIGFLR
jgi:hypothetical protein